LGIGRKEGRKEGSKGAFTAMLDTRTLGVGTEDGNSSGRSWVRWEELGAVGGSYIRLPLEHSQQHTAYTQGRLMWIAR
jgi:hypothetical protein